jgi:deoxycytidine triphosphate deaminase
MIVGNAILARGFVTNEPGNLKNSTYDLTVGQIVPIGKDAIEGQIRARARGENPATTHFLEPREMVWVLSAEEFNMPNNVTGFATLRTTFTKQGILALSVGIIDPLFRGPISTALINFSDKPRAIRVGDKFFRVVFFQHADVTAFHGQDENVVRDEYLRNLETVSYSDFAPSFLNIPSFDDKYYKDKFWSVLSYGVTKNRKIAAIFIIVLALTYLYLFHLGFGDYLGDKLTTIGGLLKKIKDAVPF